MSTSAKVVTWVIVAVVVVGGAWWWFSMSHTAGAPATALAPTAPPSGATATGTATVTDNSNAALNANLSQIDAQMNGFASDNAGVNQGLDDQPVQQSQL